MPRPRLSLSTALLLLTIVGMAIVMVRLWIEVEPLRADNRRLRGEIGELTVDDPTKIYAMQLSRAGFRSWRFRVYLPVTSSQKPYWLRIATAGIPLSGPAEQWSGSGSTLPSGEHVIDVDVLPEKDSDGRNIVVVTRGTDESHTSMKSDQYPDFEPKEPADYSWGWQSVGSEQEVFDPTSPVTLLRFRPQRKTVLGRDSQGRITQWQNGEINEPTEGLFIWIDQEP